MFGKPVVLKKGVRTSIDEGCSFSLQDGFSRLKVYVWWKYPSPQNEPAEVDFSINNPPGCGSSPLRKPQHGYRHFPALWNLLGIQGIQVLQIVLDIHGSVLTGHPGGAYAIIPGLHPGVHILQIKP